jgi:methylated-DNA-protein-cysteine methyltransferase-like protein
VTARRGRTSGDEPAWVRARERSRALPAGKPRDGLAAFFRQVYRLVRRVPRGKVVTYGQVAALLGHPRRSRAVGKALSAIPEAEVGRVPWQRVVNASGGVSPRGGFHAEAQRELLEGEGVAFDRRGKVDLERARWRGPKR